MEVDIINTYIKTCGLEFVLDGTGRAISATETATGKNILENIGAPFSCLWLERAFIESNIDMLPRNEYLYLAGELKQTSALPIPCIKAEREDSRLHLTYENGNELDFEVLEYDDYFTLELTSELPDNIYSVTFADFKFNSDREKDIVPVAFAMNLHVKPHFYPSPTEKATRAEAFSKIGARGARLAITAVKESELIALERRLADSCNPNEMTVSHAGGPFADLMSDSLGTYIIINDIDDRSQLDSIAERYKRFGIRQIDVHQGRAYVQGDFSFNKERYPGGMEDFKKNLIDPLKAHGFTMGLHPYSCFISVACTDYLSDPDSQSQLMYSETFELKEDIDADAMEMVCEEDLSGVSTVTGFRVTNSLYLLIDNEIVAYKKTESNRFVLSDRGLCSTKPSMHKRGTQIRHLSFMFNHFVPRLHSELFYRVARNIAKTYNEAGFGMIYLDALDGIPIFDEEFAWYNVATFVLEVLKNCEKPPLLEYATMFPHLWYCRSRCGAWDVPYRDYKQFLNFHAVFNETMPHMYNLPKMLGWYHFYPPARTEQFPGKQLPVMFDDDIDNLGVRAIGFNHSMTYQFLDEEYLAKYPQLKRNTERFSLYENLRIKKYFPEQVRRQLRDITREFALAEENGEYYFEEWQWRRIKNKSAKISCPFEASEVVMRIEPLYNGEGDGIVLAENTTEVIFDKYLDLGTKQTLRLEAEGVGDGESKMLVELIDPEHRECVVSSYVFDVGFEGTGVLIAGEDDNSVIKDSFEGHTRNVCTEHLFSFDYSQLHKIKIYKKGSLPSTFRLSAVETVPSVIENPTVTVNGEALSFKCTLKTGEYLELRGDKAVIKDILGYSREVEFTGTLPIASEIDAEADTELPIALTFGIKGNKIQ